MIADKLASRSSFRHHVYTSAWNRIIANKALAKIKDTVHYMNAYIIDLDYR